MKSNSKRTLTGCLAAISGIAVLAVFVSACGGNDQVQVQTVIREVQTPVTVTEPAPVKKKPKPSTPSAPPNVVGLKLPQAKRVLAEAGYKTSATNTDTTFGILVPSNYTVCRQDPPVGIRVPVLAQKYGC